MQQLDPVAAARYQRTELRLGLDNPIPDILALVEENVGIPVTVWPLAEGIAGAYGRKSDRAFIFVNSDQWPVRRRFTLAHELGHHVLHGTGMVDREVDVFGNPSSPREQQANAFAAEFLVPLLAVQNWMEREHPDGQVDLGTVVKLAADFGVSATVARIRLEKARYLPRQVDRSRLAAQIEAGEHRTLHRDLELNDYRDGLDETAIARGETRLARELWDNAVRSYQLGLASLEELAHTRRIDPKELGEEFSGAGIVPLVADEVF